MDNSKQLVGFDDHIELDAILKPALRERLLKSLAEILQQPVAIQESPIDGYICEAITYELEPIAYICVPGISLLLPSVAELVQAILFERIRYRLAANLHMETIQRDFDSLQEKHAALMDSELRYRELANQLEQRVAEQIKVIDARQWQLYQGERMRAVGQLAAGMAHEINNPLGFINSNLCTATHYVHEIGEWLGMELDHKQRLLLEDFSSLLDETKEGVMRIAVIMKDLRIFSNLNGSQTSVISISALLESTLNMLKPLCSESIVIDTELNELPMIACQPAQLAQAFFNLLQNAIEAMPNGGRLNVIARLSQNEIYVHIGDTGVGMSSDQLMQACNPFYTTKEVGAGPGLGLTVAHEVAKLHKGNLELVSVLGRGTEAIFCLPISNCSV